MRKTFTAERVPAAVFMDDWAAEAAGYICTDDSKTVRDILTTSLRSARDGIRAPL